MRDLEVNWRNHHWSYDADYVEREDAPILSALISKYESFFDETYIYIFQGKAKQYIIRFPHYNLPRSNYRTPTEKYKPKNPFQRKLSSS